MRQRIGFESLHADALAALPETMDGHAPLPVPQTSPLALDVLFSDATLHLASQ
jgi:hypothetical protein